MDPVSQGLAGALAAQTASPSRELRAATLAGFIAGLLADLDILIRSASDPLLSIQYHRHVTHSLIFIPVGGLVGALLVWPLLRKRLGFAKIYLYATLGYATCGLLDACTSYGTQLLWPFSDVRVAWNVISIVDPIFTGTIAILLLLAFLKRRPLFARLALVWAGAYLILGVVQGDRATDFLTDVAQERGHEIQRITVKPTLGNLILWRGIYENAGRFHVDGVRVGLFTKPKLYKGNSIQKFSAEKDLSKLDPNSVLYGDIQRFRHFSDDYLVFYPAGSNRLGDIRYAYLPHTLSPLWGITIDTEQPDQHVPFVHERNLAGDKVHLFWRMLRGD